MFKGRITFTPLITWRNLKFFYKRLFKWNKWKFFKIPKVRRNRRRNFGRFRSTFLLARLLRPLTVWATLFNYKNPIWHITYKQVLINPISRYSVRFFNKIWFYPKLYTHLQVNKLTNSVLVPTIPHAVHLRRVKRLKFQYFFVFLEIYKCILLWLKLFYQSTIYHVLLLNDR